MSDFEIDKTVPIPPDDRASYPLDTMEVGDSFTFPLEKRQSIQTLASKHKQAGRVYRVRKISEQDARVWRVS